MLWPDKCRMRQSLERSSKLAVICDKDRYTPYLALEGYKMSYTCTEFHRFFFQSKIRLKICAFIGRILRCYQGARLVKLAVIWNWSLLIKYRHITAIWQELQPVACIRPVTAVARRPTGVSKTALRILMNIKYFFGHPFIFS